eukprot:13074231-Ditylum_brightwellii.AAC.1
MGHLYKGPSATSSPWSNLPPHGHAKISPASSKTVRFEGAATGPLLLFGLAPSDPWQNELQQC